MKICTRCKLLKEFSEFGKNKTHVDGYRSECKKCRSYFDKLVYNKEKESNRKKKFYKLNRKQIIKKTSKYNINRRKIDVMFKIKHNIRKRIRNILLSKRLNKNNNFVKYIGCTLLELKVYIEQKFQVGMTWNNYGKWEIDHIIPLSKATTSEELYKLNHYTNLQPLWMSENRSKFNK